MNAGFLRVAKLNGHHNRVEAGRAWQAGRHERRGNYSKKLLTLRVESFVTLSWSTAGSARRRWGGAWGRCAWCGWGGDDLEVVHRAHCHRLRVEANQSNRSLTPQPQYQLQVDWDGKSPLPATEEEKERKQSWQKLTFGVGAAISESAVAEKGGGGGSFQNISKGFPKHSQPAATTFLFQSPDFRLINLVIVLLSDYSDLPNFPQSSWLHDNQSILANILTDIFSLSTSATWIFK